jgi:hypothetical protein
MEVHARPSANGETTPPSKNAAGFIACKESTALIDVSPFTFHRSH